jgi:hypothetical protein
LIIDGAPAAIMIGTSRFVRQGVHRLLWQPLREPYPPVLSVDPYVIDSLMPDLAGHDRQPSAFIVYLVLWRLTHGAAGAPNNRARQEDAGRVQIALTDLAERSGLSKRAVQDALAWLVKRKLLEVERAGITAIPVYTVLRPWLRGA